MGKNPAFQFYPSDWTRDLEEHPLEIEGAWIRICCKLWWEEERGRATKTLTQWSRVLRVGEKKSLAIIDYLDKQKIANVINQNPTITIESRRMVKDEYIRNIRVLSGSKGGNPNLKKQSQNSDLDNQNLVNQNPTPSSSVLLSSSSTSKKKINNKILYLDFVYLAEEEHGKLVEQFGDAGTKERIERLNNYLGSTGKKYRSHYFTILNWERRNGNGKVVSSNPVAEKTSGTSKYDGIGEVLD